MHIRNKIEYTYIFFTLRHWLCFSFFLFEITSFIAVLVVISDVFFDDDDIAIYISTGHPCVDSCDAVCTSNGCYYRLHCAIMRRLPRRLLSKMPTTWAILWKRSRSASLQGGLRGQICAVLPNCGRRWRKIIIPIKRHCTITVYCADAYIVSGAIKFTFKVQ